MKKLVQVLFRKVHFSDLNLNFRHFLQARTETAVNLMKECRTQENKENERERALERGRIAEMKIQKEKNEAEQKIKETNERKRLVRNLENLRSSLVTNLQQKTLGQASRSIPNKQQPSVPDNSKSDKVFSKFSKFFKNFKIICFV